MSVAITDQASTIQFLFSTGEKTILDKSPLNIKEKGRWVYITTGTGFLQTFRSEVLKLHYSEVSSPSVASNTELITTLLGYKASSSEVVGDVRITDGTTVAKVELNGSLPVTLQDQHTPVVITKFSQLEETTTTTGAVAIDDYVFPVADATGISPGKYLSVFDPASVRFSNFTVVSVASLNVTVDSPIDFAFPSGSYVDVQDTDLSVDGSSAPVVFGIRNNAGAVPPPGINLSMDVTRVIFKCYTATAPTLATFGDIAALANGLMCRKRDGEYHNIFNFKDNGQLAGMCYDFKIETAIGSGQDGFYARLTWAGQNKMGVTERLAINEDLELIVQDNLTGITSLEVTAEGSIVQP
jgi:hypothetical protein